MRQTLLIAAVSGATCVAVAFELNPTIKKTIFGDHSHIVYTSTNLLVLIVSAAGCIHWLRRGGRWQYLPDTRSGRIVFALAGLILLASLVSAGVLGPNVFTCVLAAALLLDHAYSAWRRERDWCHLNNTPLAPPNHLAFLVGMMLWIAPLMVVQGNFLLLASTPNAPPWTKSAFRAMGALDGLLFASVSIVWQHRQMLWNNRLNKARADSIAAS